MTDALGVFDSGVGGLSVVRAIWQLAPREDIEYWGDTAHMPYGDRPAAQIRDLTVAGVQALAAAGCRGVVLACNTATAVALEAAQAAVDVPVVGVVGAGARAAAAAASGGAVAVLATAATVRSGAYPEELRRLGHQGTVVSWACPPFAPLVEQGRAADPASRQVVADTLAPLVGQAGTVVLGCTHYPFLTDAIRDVLGDVTLVDPAAGAAAELLDRCGRRPAAGLLNVRVTGDPAAFAAVAEQLIGRAAATVAAAG